MSGNRLYDIHTILRQKESPGEKSEKWPRTQQLGNLTLTCAGPYILGTRKSPQHIFCIILSRENKMPWEGEQGQRVMKRMII